MKENQRKCLKCGRSPANDANVKLFRFPQPGIRNTIRCEIWAKYCYPNEICSTEFQTKLYSEHRMLCDKHFKISAFIDFSTKKLHRFAVPEDDSIEKISSQDSSAAAPIPGPSKPVLFDVTNSDLNLPILQATEQVLKVDGSKILLDSTIPKPGPSHKQLIKQNTGFSWTSEAATIRRKHDETIKQHHLYMKYMKNMKTICQLRNRVHTLKNNIILKALESENAVNVLIKRITPSLALLLQGEIKNFRRKSRGRRWTKEQKITALRLYKRSPTCYRLLRRLFCLPTPSTLKALLNQFECNVGINKKIFDIIKGFIATQDNKDNEYILMFDEMSIRKHLQYNNKYDYIEGFQDHDVQGRSPQIATHALVFMICGIRKKLKQPVAFYLSGSSVTGDRLAVLIKEVIYKCFEANINVSAIVCDMDGVNRRAFANLGATSQNPCIEINGHTMSTIFDPPHLLKCFRNIFMKYDIKHLTNVSSGDTTGIGIAKFSHIKNFYELDNMNTNFVFAPCLRQEHITPNTKQKMRVKLAAQVLSHSVAAGMYCKISQGELTSEATITANLIANMDKLFDCLNSDTPDLRRGKPHATNLTEKTPHLKFFKQMKLFFQTLELVQCRSKPPSVDGWVWTLNAIEVFWTKLKFRHPSIRSLATRRLQQDPLENLFGCIRGHCGSNTNPTAGQFMAGLKTAVLSCLANAEARSKGNCEADANQAMIENFKILLRHSEQPTAADSPVDLLSGLEESIKNFFEENIKEVTGEVQSCAYVCGFIIKSYKEDCGSCKKNLSTENLDLEHNFLQAKEYDQSKKSLNYASKALIKCVEHCATVANTFLDNHAHEKKIKQNICNYILNTVNFDFINCILHSESLKKHICVSIFYICVKRFCTLKNRQFIEQASAIALRKKVNILKHI